MPNKPLHLRLLSRTYCHLCHDMEVALAPLLSAVGASVEVVDVDEDEALEARWGELVPVLLHGDTELCHYFLDQPRVAAYLQQHG